MDIFQEAFCEEIIPLTILPVLQHDNLFVAPIFRGDEEIDETESPVIFLGVVIKVIFVINYK